MIIRVQTVGTRRNLQRGIEAIRLEVPEATSVAELMKLLQLAEWEVGFILVNNRQQFKETILHEGDYVTLIAPLTGG